MYSHNTHRIPHSGKNAYDLLGQYKQATIQGKSSRGIFLNLESSWIIFLSFEDKKGPLTLNFHGDPGELSLLELGSQVILSREHIDFPDFRISISLKNTKIWQAPPLPETIMAPNVRRDYLTSIFQSPEFNPKQSPLAGCLSHVIGAEHISDTPPRQYIGKVIELQQTCQANQSQAIIASLCKFLGLGSGLTPSGDDLIAGFLLCLNRWGYRLCPQVDAQQINQEIVSRIKGNTNLISENLIECACKGEADERLLSALDGIIAQNIEPTECSSHLRDWGSSSGFDALVGMAIFTTSPFRSAKD